ncbi:hypothetical protein TNCV_3162991 [Trichonephila clavipes]|nr:hypothetical protein TNCV_3162991 [Trichonephila clavipes]
MAFLLSKKTDHQIELAKALGLIVEASLTKPKLKDIIVKSADYVEDDVKTPQSKSAHEPLEKELRPEK